jgi:hypothetical protein
LVKARLGQTNIQIGYNVADDHLIVLKPDKKFEAKFQYNIMLLLENNNNNHHHHNNNNNNNNNNQTNEPGLETSNRFVTSQCSD